MFAESKIKEAKPEDDDDIVIDWARRPDISSDAVVYEEQVHESAPQRRACGARQMERRKGHAINEKVELDVDADILGSFKGKLAYQACERLGYTLLASLIGILVFAEHFEAAFGLTGTVPDVDWTKSPPLRMARENVEELLRFGFLVAASQTVMRLASLFTILKPNGRHRLIVNGIPGNGALGPPHYFRFFSPEDWVRRLRSLGKFYAVSVDVKQHFNRLKWNKSFAHYYAVHAGGGRMLVPTCLAMGAKASVSIGQAASWLLVAYTEGDSTTGEDTLGLNMPKDPGMLPSIVELVAKDGTINGYIFVTVDNIAVYTTDESQRERWRIRLKRNAAVLGLAPFKEELLWDHTYCMYVGIHYTSGAWNHCVDRMDRWKDRYGNGQGSVKILTAKGLQRIVGVFTWDCRVRRKDISQELRDLYAMQARASRPIKPVKPTQEEWEGLRRYWKSFSENALEQWTETAIVRMSGRTTCYMATDASGGKAGRWSYLEMVDGRVSRTTDGRHINPSGTFPEEVATPIYYRELYALLRALEALYAQGRKGCVIVAVIDSAALYGSITKKIVPEAARMMMSEIKRMILASDWILVPKWIESAGNVSHDATHTDKHGRAMLIDRTREARTWEVAIGEDYAPPKRTKRSRGNE